MMYADNRCTYVEGFDRATGIQTYTYTGPCIVTGKPHSVTIRAEELFAYRQGAKLQDAFKSLTDCDREFLLTGVSPEGWKQTFRREEEDDEDSLSGVMSEEEADQYAREIDEEVQKHLDNPEEFDRVIDKAMKDAHP